MRGKQEVCVGGHKRGEKSSECGGKITPSYGLMDAHCGRRDSSIGSDFHWTLVRVGMKQGKAAGQEGEKKGEGL